MADFARMDFTVTHLLLLFPPRITQGGLVMSEPHGTHSLLGDLSDPLSRGDFKALSDNVPGPDWLSQFIAVAVRDLHGVNHVFP